MSTKVLRDQVRAMFTARAQGFFADAGEEVLVTGTNEFAMPVVDAEGNELWVQVVIKVPTGGRDGEGYDGYAMAEDFQMKQEAKAAKTAERERQKAEKIAKQNAKKSTT